MSDSNSTLPSGFRVIPGFPRYAINDHGKILSVCHCNGRGKDNSWTNARALTHVIGSKGYHQVVLCGESGEKQSHVHVLVLEAFVGPRPDGYHCRHLDGNKDNNHISNLTWGTSLENAQDKILHGTVSVGEKNGSSKLNADNVLEIRSRAANGEAQRAIARDFSVTQANISLIVRRQKWKHI